MNDDVGFVERIQNYPFDLTLRHIYADWLEDRGDVRGVLIRSWFALQDAAAVFRARLHEGFAEEADYQQFRRAVQDYQRPLKRVDPAWMRQLGEVRPWIALDLAFNLARLYLGGFGPSRQAWRWIARTGTQEMGRAWMIPYMLPEAYEGLALSRNRSWMLIHKMYATVAQVGSSGPTPALATMEWHWLEE
jgi:uncharacterized protein (TIGR02996 family)